MIDWASLEGAWRARTLAFGAALSFALYSLATRGERTPDLDAALVAVGIVSALICAIAVLWLGLPMAASFNDAALALLHGAVIVAIGLFLFARGSQVCLASPW